MLLNSSHKTIIYQSKASKIILNLEFSTQPNYQLSLEVGQSQFQMYTFFKNSPMHALLDSCWKMCYTRTKKSAQIKEDLGYRKQGPQYKSKVKRILGMIPKEDSKRTYMHQVQTATGPDFPKLKKKYPHNMQNVLK